MMTKTAYYMQMAQEAAAQITGSKEQWTAFLTTSARLYNCHLYTTDAAAD